MNVFTGIGRVGRDAQTRFTQAGQAVTGWPVAIDTGYGDRKQTTWIDCAMWGERGQKVADYIRKGDRIGVTGELGTREHEGKTYVTLRINDVTLLGEKRDSGSSPQRQEPTRSHPNRQAPPEDFSDDIPF